MSKVECPYREDCIDIDKLCQNCLNNKKRSYYKAREPSYQYSSYPCNPYWTYTVSIPSIWDNTTSISAGNTDSEIHT